MLLVCFGLTVVFDMVIAVTVGVVFAALLFMRRMASLTWTEVAVGSHPALPRELPPGAVVYDINGPLFFGAAQKAMATLGIIGNNAHVVILRMESVPFMDATGLVALESALDELRQRRCLAVILGLTSQPERVLRDAGIVAEAGRLVIAPDAESAIRASEDYLKAPLTERRLKKQLLSGGGV